MCLKENVEGHYSQISHPPIEGGFQGSIEHQRRILDLRWTPIQIDRTRVTTL